MVLLISRRLDIERLSIKHDDGSLAVTSKQCMPIMLSAEVILTVLLTLSGHWKHVSALDVPPFHFVLT